MSTYNGERYLKEQTDSILGQVGVSVSLIVRDDGSTDGTHAILDDYRRRGLLTWYTGANMGPQRSFMQLLREAPASEFYAFADQDDVWLPGKLLEGVRAFSSGLRRPALFCSQTQLTDASLQPLPTPQLHPRRTFAESLVYAYASGCTMVFNHELRQAVERFQPQFLDMHDRWLVDVVLALGGELYFSSHPLILYRQHTSNAVGLHDSFWKEWHLRIQRITQSQSIRSRMAKEIYEGYHDIMPEATLRQLQLFIDAKTHFWKRCHLLAAPSFRCGDKKTWLLFKLAVLLNTY